MKQVPVNFIGAAYESESVPWSAQETTNWYPVVSDDPFKGTRSVVALFPTPGLDLVTHPMAYGSPAIAANDTECRGTYQFGDYIYIVYGNGEVYQISPTGSPQYTLIGAITAGTGRVAMVDNRIEIIIVDGVSGWTYNTNTTAFSEITDVDFRQSDTVAYLDGYIILNEVDSDRFYISAVLDARTYDSTEVATAEADSDNLVSVFVNRKDLMLFGKKTIEFWRNTDNVDFPFEPNTDMIFERGCAAKYSIKRVNQIVYFLGDDYVVYAIDNYNIYRVSTYAVEQQIKTYVGVSNAIADVYSEKGHHFYILTFPDDNVTWCFDSSQKLEGGPGLWHRRSFGISKGRWRGQNIATLNGKHYCGDYQNSKVYNLNETKYSDTDNNDEIIHTRTTMPFADNENILEMPELTFTFEMGTGLVIGQGSDPQIMLQISNDAGRTYGPEIWDSVGKIGEYENEVSFRRLGPFKNRVYKVECSDPVKWVFIAASAKVRERKD